MSQTVSRDKWLMHRRKLLDEEKEFDRLRDKLSAKRRQLPKVAVSEDYQFTGASGPVHLSELFKGHSQLIIYHFMYAEDWDAGCPSCSFWADNFNGIAHHLGARDAGFAAISIAPIDKLMAYEKRMNWNFIWVSSHNNSFNRDFDVSSTEQERSAGTATYNYKKSIFPVDEAPGISVFSRDENGAIFHTYSTYSRGIDMLNGAYHYMDLLPKGRDEAKLSYSQEWIKRNDEY